MTSIPTDHGALSPPPDAGEAKPFHETYEAPGHFHDADHEFDAVKMGVWLFLATEVLLFAGMFVAYGIFRMLYPEAWINGSKHLDVQYGLINTVVLLYSSYTVASAVRNAQLNQQAAMRRNLLITLFCGVAFLGIKLIFEYIPKWQQGKRPGGLFEYAGATEGAEPIWWSVYWVATGIHASHVIIGIALFFWVYMRSRAGRYGPKHYNMVEGCGLYWHIVDIVWIFLFPLLYLVH